MPFVAVEQRRSSKRLQARGRQVPAGARYSCADDEGVGEGEGAAEQGWLACERSAGQGDFHTASQGGLSFRRRVVDRPGPNFRASFLKSWAISGNEKLRESWAI